MNRLINDFIHVIKECGQLILEADRSSILIDSKAGPANFVTEYDKKVQDLLEEKLKAIVPEAHFVGEEESADTVSGKGKYFVVDPIDGTTNFIKDYHVSCISVALIEDGQVQIGIVYNPYLDEMFYAEKGKGAYCNGQKLQVSRQPLSNGIVLFGTSPYYEELHQKSFQMAYEYFKQALDIRRSGSAALDLCSIAAGRAELYFELKLSPWDYAAGSLIVEEAGGIVTTVEGNPVTFDRPCSVLARNTKISVFSKDMDSYLETSDVVDYYHSSIKKVAEELCEKAENSVDYIRLVYEYVRDCISHSADIKEDVITCAASEVLAAGHGICFAKAHLLAALLRCKGIPAGFCYQKLILDDDAAPELIYHGLNGVYIEELGKWIRLDARGNKEGVDAQFSLETEQLAFPIRMEKGEEDESVIYPSPDKNVLISMKNSKTRSELWENLPTELDFHK